MITETFLYLRFEIIEKRFNEINLLISLAEKNKFNNDMYQALCRSAHVLLVSHFEGLYKDICRDIVDDLNLNTRFFEVRKIIFNTHCLYYIQNNESEKSIINIKQKLWEAFKDYPSKIKVEPFLFVDNKNPTPVIIETILQKFGIKNFFSNIDKSDLDIAFEDQKSSTLKLRNKLLKYLKKNTQHYPYTVDTIIYNPSKNIRVENKKKHKSLWEDFLNNFLKDRHNIIHGHIIDNPYDHEALLTAKVKIEIIVYAFIINICSVSTPVIHLKD